MICFFVKGLPIEDIMGSFFYSFKTRNAAS